MARPYGQMTAKETLKFQTVIAHYRAARAAKWAAAEACKLLAAEVDSIATLGNELEAPSEAIPRDARQGDVSMFATNPSWNALVNERNACATFATAEQVTALAAYQAAIGADQTI